MEGYEPPTYGDRIADVYDEWYAELDPASAVELLAELAGDGRVLELAIGSGRIALPLAARGVEVHGIDASERMVERLRAKPGGEAIPVTMGDFADVPVEGTFRVVFVAFNTLFALPDQEAQVRCFERVSEHLDENGVFVLEAFVPDLARYDRGQRVSTTRTKLDHIVLDVSQLDAASQTVFSPAHPHLRRGDDGSSPCRCGTRGRPSSTSWPGSPASGSARAMRTGRGRRSRPRRRRTSRSTSALDIHR